VNLTHTVFALLGMYWLGGHVAAS